MKDDLEFVEIEDESDLHYNPDPICPHCGYIDADWNDHSFRIENDDTFDYECPSCDEKCTITCNVRFTFSTSKL